MRKKLTKVMDPFSGVKSYGIYYNQLGVGSTLPEVRAMMEKRTGWNLTQLRKNTLKCIIKEEQIKVGT